MRNHLILTLMALSLLSCSADDDRWSLQSPDGAMQAHLHLRDGTLLWSLDRRNTAIVQPSRLGLVADRFDLASGLRVLDARRASHDSTWETVWGEEREIRNHYNALTLELANGEGQRMDMVLRLFDDGLGFRYRIPEQPGLGDFNIMDERTEFRMAEDAQSWWIPAYAYRRYEFLYANTPISAISRDTYSDLVEQLNGPRLGPEAVHTPFTMQRADGMAISIHEADLTDYASMTLAVDGSARLEADLVPWSDGVRVRASAPMQSPWRTIQVADNAAGLLSSRIALNLSPPNRLQDSSWIQPGKYIGLWWEMIGTNQSTWGSGPHHGAKTESVKPYLDFAAEHGFGGVLVEGWNLGWDENWCCTGEGEAFRFYDTHPEFDIAELHKYAEARGVRLIGHHETGTQIANYEEQLEQAMAFAARHGIRVIKTGYVTDVSRSIKRWDADGKLHREWHHGQYMVRHWRKVLEAAARHRISLVVHEPIKGTGLRRTWPNMLSREGARGQEFNGFMSRRDNNQPNHTTILPFTRLLAGPMDYTPGIFKLTKYRQHSQDDPRINEDHHIPSTIAKELALYVIIHAPVQMAADLPQHYDGHPAFQFILDVPTDWQRTEVLNGEIGQYLSIARQDRHSDDWYLGSITNEQPRTLEVRLDFLEPGRRYRATRYADPADGGWETNPEGYHIDSTEVTSTDSLRLQLAPGGGQAIRLQAL